MRRFNGFSLMEMMVVLLIVAIVAAAAAPMVNKKILATAGEKSPWVFTGVGQNIAYDINNNSHAVIGGPDPSNNAKLTIHNSDDNLPYIAFDNTSLYVNDNILRFTPVPLNDSDSTSDIVVLGTEGTTAQVAGGVAIGNDAVSRASNSIAIGNAINNRLANSIMIGRNIDPPDGDVGGDESSIAISSNTQSRKIGATSVAIGNSLVGHPSDHSVSVGHATSVAQSATAIGISARAIGVGSIAIGSAGRSEEWVKACGNGFLSPVYAAISKTPSSTTSSSSTSGDDSMKAPPINPPTSVPIEEPIEESDPNLPAVGVEELVVSSTNATMARGDFSIAIGQGAETKTRSVAIGKEAKANAENAVLIGDNAIVNANFSIAIGDSASVSRDAQNSVAIGQGAIVRQNVTNSVAIGQGAVAGDANQIVLGRSTNAPTVVIPGDLEVRGTVKVTGETTFSKDLVVSGIVNAKDFLESSDRRLKNVGEAFTAGLEEIKKLEVFNYTFKKDESKTPRVGVMAQDLEKIFPKAVFKGEDGFLRIRMEDMFYALVNAVKQLDAKIEELKNNEILTLKNRLDDLEKANKELRKENEALEKRLDKLEKKFNKKLED